MQLQFPVSTPHYFKYFQFRGLPSAIHSPLLYPDTPGGKGAAAFRESVAQKEPTGRCKHRTLGIVLAYHTTATFTQWIGGRESNRQFHSSPPSRPIQSCPVVVPK